MPLTFCAFCAFLWRKDFVLFGYFNFTAIVESKKQTGHCCFRAGEGKRKAGRIKIRPAFPALCRP